MKAKHNTANINKDFVIFIFYYIKKTEKEGKEKKKKVTFKNIKEQLYTRG